MISINGSFCFKSRGNCFPKVAFFGKELPPKQRVDIALEVGANFCPKGGFSIKNCHQRIPFTENSLSLRSARHLTDRAELNITNLMPKQ